MRFNNIVSQYYQNKELTLFFKNIANDWWEELRQDVFLTICEYDEQKIIDMHDKKCLKFFIVRIGINQFRSKTSKFYYQNFKNQRMSDSLVDDELIENSDAILYSNAMYDLQDETPYQVIEAKIQNIENSIEQLRYFEREILKLYLRLGTYKKVSQDTGIPIRTVANGVKNAILNVKSKIKEND